MVFSVKSAGIFDSDEVIRPLDDAKNLPGSPFILTDEAWILICQVETG
jgi:hypothetical protein